MHIWRMAERLAVRNFILLLMLFFTTAAFAVVLPSHCERAMRRAFNAKASWVMSRTVPGAVRPLVSTGVVSFAVKKGIRWEVRHPFVESVTMTTNEMIFADEDSRRVKPLSQLPHYTELQNACDSFFSGDSKAFDGIFDSSVSITSNGAWTVTMVPSVSAMRRLMTKVEVSGCDTLDHAVIYTGDGGKSSIRFKELPGVVPTF